MWGGFAADHRGGGCPRLRIERWRRVLDLACKSGGGDHLVFVRRPDATAGRSPGRSSAPRSPSDGPAACVSVVPGATTRKMFWNALRGGDLGRGVVESYRRAGDAGVPVACGLPDIPAEHVSPLETSPNGWSSPATSLPRRPLPGPPLDRQTVGTCGWQADRSFRFAASLGEDIVRGHTPQKHRRPHVHAG